jgi:hypothetical protein
VLRSFSPTSGLEEVMERETEDGIAAKLTLVSFAVWFSLLFLAAYDNMLPHIS